MNQNLRKPITMRLGSVTFAAGLALTALAPAAQAAAPNRPCASIVVGSPQQLTGQGTDADEREFNRNDAAMPNFSATGVIDIEFAIVLAPGAAADYRGMHVVEFRTYTPRGNLYQSISIPFTTDPSRKGTSHRVAGYPDVLPVRVLKAIKTPGGGNGLIVKVTLPVAGTPILQNSLYGTWRAEALIDDDRVACSSPASFVITQ